MANPLFAKLFCSILGEMAIPSTFLCLRNQPPSTSKSVLHQKCSLKMQFSGAVCQIILHICESTQAFCFFALCIFFFFSGELRQKRRKNMTNAYLVGSIVIFLLFMLFLFHWSIFRQYLPIQLTSSFVVLYF